MRHPNPCRGSYAAITIATLGLAMLLVAGSAIAQPSFYEVEPNDTPDRFTPIQGEVTLIGTMQEGDQDGFLWAVSDVDAQKRWTFELQGVPGRLTIVEVLRLEYADNGVDVVGTEGLFKMGTRDGSIPSIQEDLIFEPGDYILGLAGAGGGEGPFRPPIDSIGFDESGSGPTAEGRPLGGYRFAIREGSRIPLEHQPKERASVDSAHKLRLGSESAAYLESNETWYAIEIGEEQAGQRWEIDGQVPIGREVEAALRAGDGSELTSVRSNDQGKFRLPDLGLEIGSYKVAVTAEDTGYIRALAITSVGQRIEGAEAEPNDSWQLANRADLSQPLTGRMGRASESDYFLIAIDEETAEQVLNLKLETGADQSLQLCLHQADGTHVQCRSGKGTVGLPDLVLQPGDWGLVVQRGPEGAAYTVTLSTQGPIQAGVEAEPNDTVEFAAGVPSNNRIKGRFSGEMESDFYKIIVTDEPQLWRFQVIGDEIHELAYLDGAGIQNQVYRVPPGQRRVRLDNVFLLPGMHNVRVTGRDGGSYTLLARPIGPPDPNGEFEPNDDTSRMQPLRFGQPRTGLLEDRQDQDLYRFYLAAWDRIRLTIEPPPDGEIMAHLYWDKSPIKEFNQPQAGQRVDLEGLFPPGDYYLRLHPKTTSEAEYRLSLERLERFGCPTDCEPNDNLDMASPFPANHVLEGRVNEWRDTDWYALPIFDQPTAITVFSEPRQQIKLVDRSYAAQSSVQWDHQEGLWTGTVPPNVQTYLQIGGGTNAPYRLDVSFPDGPAAEPDPPAATFDLALELETTEVGAYRQHSQQVAGTLTLKNTGTASATVDLEAATSNFRWQVELEESEVVAPAGETQPVPVTVRVPIDAWADWPVRISVRATTPDGAESETFVEVNAGRETTPFHPNYGWEIPEALRGGFNVAWSALGGHWTGEEDSAIGSGFAYLFDGMAVEQQGLQLRGGTQQHTVDIVVELAGGEPIDVAGVALSQLSGVDAQRFLRNLDFALSMDGQNFTPVLEAQLLPIKHEQYFVLDRPVQARFARLQPRYAWDGAAGPGLGFGELKVMAKPGLDLSAGKGFNLAEPTLGGHVVWSRPPTHVSDWDSTLLTDPEKNRSVRLKPGQAQEFVIGFHHDRAAQISRIEWHDAPSAKESQKSRRVEISVSVDSPVGPWEPIGRWDRSDSAATSVFELERPVWARFVKFSASERDDPGIAEAPSLIRIWERPTDDQYTSILTEWGYSSQQAIYEALQPLQIEAPFTPAGHDSKAKAAALDYEQEVGGQVLLGKHEHWYRLSVPADQNTLTIALGGDPTVRTVVELETASGEPIPVRKVASESTPQLHTFEAIVAPGETCFLRVEEPPRNVIFTWDTSASVGAYLPVIYNAMMAYAEDLVPGRDAANLVPFGTDLLLRDWYGEPFIMQTVLNDYPRKESSSEAEKTLHTASEALAPRSGTKAIVVMTDAATNRYHPVWDSFESVQPRIFGLGVGSQGALGRNPPSEQDLMQDWSRVNGGHYSYLLSEGDMEVAFDRATTMLRRPAGYTLTVTSTFREAPGPGTLEVVFADDEIAGGAAIELILDASGSMLKRLDGKRRITIAKETLTEAVTKHLPAGTPVALRVFGHKEPNACRTDLEIPLKPLDPAAASKTIAGVDAMNLAKTPIADSLAKVEADLQSGKGRRVVVLVTDGEETCDGDPEKVIQALQDKGIEVTLNIVGFAIDNAALESQFESWAALGGGRYFSAKNQEGLSESLKEALRVPYLVYNSAGTQVREGVVDGEPVELEQGFYRVVVQTSPLRTFENVEVPGEQEISLKLE